MSSSSSGGKRKVSAGGIFQVLIILVMLALATLVVIVPLKLNEQFFFGAVVFLVSFIISKIAGRVPVLMLVVISMIASSRYLYWRILSTLDLGSTLELVLGIVLLSAEIYCFIVLFLGYIQSLRPIRRDPVPLPPDPRSWPTVDVFIPTYNEPLDVVRATTLAAREMDWPHDKLTVYILDDGRRDEFADFAREAGVQYITRADNAHAKAGNINNALKTATGQFVAIFDCDHVPVRSFLQMTMGILVDRPNMAMVQTPHHFNSPDPFERNLGTFRKIPNEGKLFYGLLLPGSDLWNAVFFCGSCAVVRRSALDEIGGIAVETVTEDAHTGLRLHRKGYETSFFEVSQASGLATESLSAHIGQRIRWARGMVQIFRSDNPLLGRGLDVFQRLCYSNSMIHFLNGLPRLIFLTSPFAFLFFGLNLFNATTAFVVAYALPHLLHANITNSRIQGKVRHSFWAEVYEAVLSIYILIPTTLALINPKLGKFNVTAKGGLVQHNYFDRKIALPYIILLLANVAAIAYGVYSSMNDPTPPDALTINIVWASYNIIVLGAAVAVAYEAQQRRSATRIEVEVPAMLMLPNDYTLSCSTEDLARGGASVVQKGDMRLPKGEKMHLCLFLGTEEVALPCRVANQIGSKIGLAFDDLSDAEETALVRAIYSRADAWIDWSDEIARDRPLRSLLRVLGHALTGIPRMFGLGGRKQSV